MNNPEKNLRQIIEDKITHGDVKQKARWYFIVRKIIIITGIILALCLMVYLVSFIFFIFYDQGRELLRDFGWEGTWKIIISLPWIIILLIIILFGIIELLGWRFTRLYRQPFIYSMLGLGAIIILASAAIEYSHLHRTLSESADNNQLPIAGTLYTKVAHPLPKEVYFGIVIEQTPEEWKIESRGRRIPVIITTQTRFPRGKNIVPLDRVIIMGPLDHGSIRAFGIRKIDPDRMPKIYIIEK
jgi:hypothetical protein